MSGDGGDAGVEVILIDGIAVGRAETPERRYACQSKQTCVQRPSTAARPISQIISTYIDQAQFSTVASVMDVV